MPKTVYCIVILW